MSRIFRSILTDALVTVALLATCVPASADGSAVFKGKVVDFSGTAIKKVSVVLISDDDSSVRLTAKSDKNGHFEIAVKDVSLSYLAQLGKTGYAGFETPVEFSAGDHTLTLELQETSEGVRDPEIGIDFIWVQER